MTIEQDVFDAGFDSLEQLADTISDVLRRPVTIEDANHRLLAYSCHDPGTDPARIATIVGRRVPENVISSLWESGVIRQLSRSPDPVRIAAIREIGLGNRIATAIRKNSDILGYIWVLEGEERLGDEAVATLKKAARAAKTKLLQLQLQRRKEEEGHQDFFWQLLTGHYTSEAPIREKAERLGIRLPPSFHVLAFHFPGDIDEKLHQQIRYVLTTLQRVRVVCHAVSRHELILLCASSNATQTGQDFTDFIGAFDRQLRERFGISPREAGIGSRYEDYTLAERSYQEALTVLRIKQQFPRETKLMHHYHDLGYYRFLPLILAQKQLHKYENPCLRRLREYDREHNSCLLQTLETFLGNDSNMKVTADLLHIHANTLNYRLKRIAEIGGIDLTDTDQKVTLYLDLKTEKLH